MLNLEIKNSSHDTLFALLSYRQEVSELKETIRQMTIEIEDLKADTYYSNCENIAMEASHDGR